MAHITLENIKSFELWLKYNEKSSATAEKYTLAVKNLYIWLDGRDINKSTMMEYRQWLISLYKPVTVNGKLSAVNNFLMFIGLGDFRIRYVKIQPSPFLKENRELTEAEYRRLLNAAKSKGNYRMYMLMMTLGSTGIRVSELAFITVESAKRGRADINMKGKCRTILLPADLCKKLLRFAKAKNITAGCIFRTRSGKAMDRVNICHRMKKLCRVANVNSEKVFPHNFRHLFARIFYSVEKNIAYLADILGHKRIETTRIYVATSVAAHQKILNKMKMVQ